MKMPAAVMVLLIAFSSSLFAQWPKYMEPGVPRDAQGRVRMDAPAPRTAAGQPDLSGDWTRADRDPLPQQLAGVVTGRGETNRGAADAAVGEPPTASVRADPHPPRL